MIAGYARTGFNHPILNSFLPARWARTAIALAAATPAEVSARLASKQLLVDVSEIAKKDAGTGVQRVVRNVLLQLFRNPPTGYEIRPVYATRSESYRYADRFHATLLNQSCIENPDLPVEIHPGDIFFGLDLAAHLLPHHHRTLGTWKEHGVKLYFLMHDLLPVRRPEWFNPRRQKTFRRWLRTLAIYSDRVICVSKATSDDLERWFLDQYGIGKDSLPVSSFHLGTDFSAVECDPSRTEEATKLAIRFRGQSSIMMVGTIEPRKGYAQAVSAFEMLWERGSQDNLIIVGKPGWKVDELIGKLRNHPEAGVRLHWFEDADDELLLQLYGMADGVLMASEAEGFGLPIIEAARFGKPILLRDIPVFREIGGVGTQYFKGFERNVLASALRDWLILISAGQAPDSRTIRCQTWAESTAQLVLGMELV